MAPREVEKSGREAEKIYDFSSRRDLVSLHFLWNGDSFHRSIPQKMKAPRDGKAFIGDNWWFYQLIKLCDLTKEVEF